MIVARGTCWRVELQDDLVVVDLQKAALPPDFHELREARFDVPLKKWNLVVKNVRSDRKLLGGVLLDYAKDKERVNLVVGSDRLMAEFRRCVVDATVALLEEGHLTLVTAERSEENS